MRVRRQRRRTAARCCVRTLRPHLAPAPWACYQEEFNTHVLASIRAKLGLVFIGFLLLVTGSVGATFLTIRAQATDALVVNLAGRQRMLTQQMTKALLNWARDPASGSQAELQAAADLFDRTLEALREGGTVPYGDGTVMMPRTADAATRAQLEQVSGLWERFERQLELAQTLDPQGADFDQALTEIDDLSSTLLHEMDRAVQLYGAGAGRKLARLRTTQALFFAGALVLLVAGYVATQQTIVKPISALEAVSRRIAGGDLESPVDTVPSASAEVGALARSLEDLRREQAASRLELQGWAAELEARVDRRTEQLAALFEVSSEISSKLDLRRVLDLVVEKTRQLVAGDVAALCLLEPSGSSYQMVAVSGPEEAFAARPPATLDHGTAGKASAAQALDLHEERDCPLLQPEFRRSHLAVPLRIGDRVLGMLCVGDRDEGRFGEEETRLLSLLAQAGAVALENARLYEGAEESAALAERERIIAEIHDGLAQTLSYIGLRLGVVEALIEDEELVDVPEHLALLDRTVDRAGLEIRQMMADLQAAPQGPRALEELLAERVARFAEERGMEVELQVDVEPPIWERPEVTAQVLRVVQEALTNVHKHVPSGRATVTLERHDRQMAVSVRDEGPGFDSAGRPGGDHHFGLRVMETRANRIGGQLDVASAPEQGTTVTLSWVTAEV